ncbi:hypothetical protein DFJ67_8450 [Asanoa ferruginea]|uniref:Uncharacterized protein n=1 Tax=Asanoa ferruginea TaxID=53367 RepID=A0A3D9ZZ36_9ACTN|nr:hypothetical protein [Asanoa ferruginea]REG02356.1 hypothetical protein DFJ67_8450 [Asanoa ferruginea]GIF46591.1 hypothetical protein Afe04nite_11300 [Asanoa ferruginea]
MTLLSDTLREAAATIDPPQDPWPGFARRERAHRRARRVRRVALAAVVAAAVGAQTNVIPLPGWAPGIAVASSPWSALAGEPPRGSLTADATWLAAFRDRVTGIQNPDGFWAVAGRDRIKVLYASDAPGRRLALVLVPLRLGFITSWELIWYEGPAGAAPEQMTQGGNEDAGNPVVTLTQTDADHGGYALVIGPRDTTVTISGDAHYAARGVVERRQLAASDGTGVGVALLPPTPLPPGLDARVTRGAQVIYEGAFSGGWGSSAGDPWQPSTAQVARAVHGSRGPAPDPAILTSFVALALADSHLPAAGTTVRLRWSGTVNGQTAALLTVQPPGGGVIAYAMHGDATVSRTDLRLLLPADGADQRPLGWRLRAEGGDGRTDQVRVATPPGTATATVTIAGGPAVPVALDASGAGTVAIPPDQPATVTAYAPDGSTLGSTPVPPFENDSSRLPGDTPGTRIVP